MPFRLFPFIEFKKPAIDLKNYEYQWVSFTYGQFLSKNWLESGLSIIAPKPTKISLYGRIRVTVAYTDINCVEVSSESTYTGTFAQLDGTDAIGDEQNL